MKIINVLISIGLTLFLLSCKQPTTDDATIKISLREAWFPWAGYAGEVFAQYEIDSLYNVDFRISPGAENIDPIKMVLSGTNDFGIASAENLLLANQKGANLVAIGVLNYKSATCFLSLKHKGIEGLRDFEGKKVGILTGSETETIYRLLVLRNNLNKNKITEVEASFDLSTFINTDAYDVRPAFIYDEPVSLDIKDIEYNILRPEDYGVELVGAVYFTTREMVEKYPEKVQAFVNIIANGWEKALAKPTKAIEYLQKYDGNIDATRELASLEKGSEYFQGENGEALFVSGKAWDKLYESLKELKKIDANVDVAKSFDNSFVRKYHDTRLSRASN